MPERRSTQHGPRPFKWRQPAIRTRGPKALQRALLTSVKDTEATGIPRPQAYLGTRMDGQSLREVIAIGTEPEWRVFWALITLGLFPDDPDGFAYQVNFAGGRAVKGGAVPDFGLPAYGIALNIQGIHFHYASTAEAGKEVIVAAQLANYDVRLIAIDENDAMSRPRAVTAAALRGEDWSRTGRG